MGSSGSSWTVHPEDLGEIDRRTYDLAVQTMPDAEIAVRLGVSVREAKDRIEALLMRVGVADRATLRLGPSPVAAAAPIDEPADEDRGAEIDLPEPARIPVPLFVGASLAVGAAALAMGLALGGAV